MLRRLVLDLLRKGKALTCLQSTKDATKFYEGKVEELGNNLKALEKILQEKNDGLRMIEDGKCHGSPDLECGFNFFLCCSFTTESYQREC